MVYIMTSYSNKSFSRLSLFFIAAMLLNGCIVGVNSDSIKGTGELQSSNIDVSDFANVLMAIPGELTITQGDEESLRLSAQTNLLPYIKINVVNNRLRIETDDNISLDPTRTITIQLVVKSLDELDFAGSGLVEINTLSTTNLSVDFAGSGDVEINELSAMNLDVDFAGSGDLFLSGVVDEQNIDIAGSGDIEARDLMSQKADIEISGSGSAVLNVKDELKATINGSGSVRYIGNPVVDTEISGSGNVSALG